MTTEREWENLVRVHAETEREIERDLDRNPRAAGRLVYGYASHPLAALGWGPRGINVVELIDELTSIYTQHRPGFSPDFIHNNVLRVLDQIAVAENTTTDQLSDANGRLREDVADAIAHYFDIHNGASCHRTYTGHHLRVRVAAHPLHAGRWLLLVDVQLETHLLAPPRWTHVVTVPMAGIIIAVKRAQQMAEFTLQELWRSGLAIDGTFTNAAARSTNGATA